MKRELGFFPRRGDTGAPLDYYYRQDDHEQARLRRRLDILAEDDPHKWEHADWWEHFEDDVFEVKGRYSRAFIIVHGDHLVVIYMCKKVGQKARQNDIDRMRANKKVYLERVAKKK